MKEFEGIFDSISDEFQPGVPNLDKIIKEQAIYDSNSLKAKELPIDIPEPESFSVDDVIKPIADLKKKVKDKVENQVSDLFKLPGFSKKEMMVDKKESVGKLLEKSLIGEGAKKVKDRFGSGINDLSKDTKKAKREKEDDLMNVETKEWKDKFTEGFDI